MLEQDVAFNLEIPTSSDPNWTTCRLRFELCCIQGLGQLNEEELQEICGRLRAAGFGPGHACAFRNLCHSARGARVTWL